MLKKEYDKLFVFFELLFNTLMVKEKRERERKERLIELFNDLFKILNIKYNEFNCTIWANKEGDSFDRIVEMERVNKLIKLGEKYPELGFKFDGIGGVGISIVSLLGTVTDVLCGKRFAVRNEIGGGKIIGCGFAKFNDDGSWEIEDS